MALPLTIACVAALAASLALVPLLARLARRIGVTDKPDSLLKPHQRPIPCLGGPAFYLAWLAGLLAVQLFWPALMPRQAWLVAGLAGLVMLVGLADDVRSLGPGPRMAVELAAAVLLFLGGVRFAAIPGLAPDGWALWIVGLLIQIALVLGACNATNLLDGLDGLCGGVLAIALLGLAALAAGAIEAGGGMANRLGIVLLLAPPLAAAVVGFLVYNWRPASVFMGDAGSLMLGFAVAAVGALLSGPGLRGLHLGVSGLVIFTLPVADTALALYRRWRSGRPIYQGDRSHFYDQLVDRGLPVTRAVLACCMLAAVFALTGWVGGVLLDFGWAMLPYAVVLGAAAWALHHFRFTRLPA